MKNYRADKTYMIHTEATDNPKLGAKLLSDGRESLFLDFNYGYSMARSGRSGKIYPKKHRHREYLRLYLYASPKNAEQRRHNREVLEMAKGLRFEHEQQLLEASSGYRLKRKNPVNFLDWMEAYHDTYTKADKPHIRRARTHFISFLSQSPLYAGYEKSLPPELITPGMVEAFADHLRKICRGEGAHTLFARFKKIIKAAVEAEVIKKNPCLGIVIKIDNDTLKKDILSMEEIHRLIATHYPGENPDIRRAFIFSCYSGIRWCDLRRLTFSNVDYSNRLLRFEQAKTRGHSKASGVVLPLSDHLIHLIGTPSDSCSTDTLIFPLPSHSLCLKALSQWTHAARIDKHITWHCARHSFALNILNNGANIKTLASLLGHSGLKHTEKYTRAVDHLKRSAITGLPYPEE